MKKDPRVFLSHIIESIELIEEDANGVTQARFVKDTALQDAIIRRLEVIGEAVKGLSSSFKVKHSVLPWKQMAGMREILIHEYFNVDLILTWKVVKQELPSVKKQLLAIFEKIESDTG